MGQDNLEKEKSPNSFPKVELVIDQDFDVSKINGFMTSEDKGGGNFKDWIFACHPELKGVEKLKPEERLSKIRKYVKRFYRENQSTLETSKSDVIEEWEEYAPTFFDVTSKIVPGLKWPVGNYCGAVSMCPPFPRFLDDKKFQFPMDGRKIFVIAHEMLHFIFFEYVRKRYTPQFPNTIEGEMNKLLKVKFIIPLWELSEVFNTALMTVENFGKGGDPNPKPYPKLQKYLQTFNKIWQEANGNIDDFFTKIEV